MAGLVTDPDLLAQLNAPDRSQIAPSKRVWGDKEAEAAGLYEPSGNAVTDPALLAQLNGIEVGPSGRPRITIGARYGEMQPPQGGGADLQRGLETRATAMTRGPEVSPFTQMAVGFQNVLSGASQRTVPHTDQYNGKLISTEAFEGDDGNVYFRDPQSGSVLPTDAKTHVALRDPFDNRVKVYFRSDATNESAPVGVARVMTQGMAAGAPTARPGIATPNAASITPRASETMSTAKPYYKEFKNTAKQIGVPEETATGIGDRVRRALDGADLIPELAPAVYSALNIFDKGGVEALDRLQGVRRVVGRSFSSPDKNIREAAAVATKEIDKIISEVSKPAGRALKTANEVHSTARAQQTLQRAQEVAGLRTGRAGYGGNAVNSMRQVLSPIVEKSIKGGVTGFQPGEIAAMREIIEGTNTTNALRLVGALSPSKGILQIGAGITTGGVTAVLGMAANKLANVLTGKQIEKLNALVAKRSPTYEKAVQKAIERYENAAAEFASGPDQSKFAKVIQSSRALASGFQRDGISISSGDLLRAIQGPMKSAAETKIQNPNGYSTASQINASQSVQAIFKGLSSRAALFF